MIAATCRCGWITAHYDNTAANRRELVRQIGMHAQTHARDREGIPVPTVMQNAR